MLSDRAEGKRASEVSVLCRYIERNAMLGKLDIPFQKAETTEIGEEEGELLDLSLSDPDPPCGASISALLLSDPRCKA